MVKVLSSGGEEELKVGKKKYKGKKHRKTNKKENEMARVRSHYRQTGGWFSSGRTRVRSHIRRTRYGASIRRRRSRSW